MRYVLCTGGDWGVVEKQVDLVFWTSRRRLCHHVAVLLFHHHQASTAFFWESAGPPGVLRRSGPFAAIMPQWHHIGPQRPFETTSGRVKWTFKSSLGIHVGGVDHSFFPHIQKKFKPFPPPPPMSTNRYRHVKPSVLARRAAVAPALHFSASRNVDQPLELDQCYFAQGPSSSSSIWSFLSFLFKINSIIVVSF